MTNSSHVYTSEPKIVASNFELKMWSVDWLTSARFKIVYRCRLNICCLELRNLLCVKPFFLIFLFGTWGTTCSAVDKHSPPTSVTRVRLLYLPSGLTLLLVLAFLWGFFSSLPPSTQTNSSKLQLDLNVKCLLTTDVPGLEDWATTSYRRSRSVHSAFIWSIHHA